MDFSIIKAIGPVAIPIIGIAAKGPSTLKAIRRRNSNRRRAREAAIFREIKALKSYQENPLILVAEGKSDMLMCVLFIVGFLLVAVAAILPSKAGWNVTESLMLAVESLCMLAAGIYLFDRNASRLNKARNPHRTMVLHEIKIMRLRLDRAEADIRKRTDPILERDLQALRSLGTKLPIWNDE